MQQQYMKSTQKNDTPSNIHNNDSGSKMFHTYAVIDQQEQEQQNHHNSSGYNNNNNKMMTNHTLSTIALCCSVLSVSYMLISVFPYSGYMSIQLLERSSSNMTTTINEENVGLYAGMMASSFMIGRAISSYGWGIAADTYGRIPCLLLSLMLSSILSIGFGCSTSYAAAIIWRFTLGLVNGVLPIAKTSVSELAYGDRTLETRGMGLVMGMWGWGFLISPAIAGITAEPIKQYPDSTWLSAIHSNTLYYRILKEFPFLLPNLIGTIFGFIAFIAVWLFVPETLPKQHLKSLHEIPVHLWLSMKRALSVIPEETASQMGESVSFIASSNNNNNNQTNESTKLSSTVDRRKHYGDTRNEGAQQNYAEDDDAIESTIDSLFPDLLDDDMDDAITKARASYDEHSLLLSTTFLRESSRRSVTASLRDHSTVLSQRRRQSRLSSWKVAESVREIKQKPFSGTEISVKPELPPPTASLSSLWSQKSTRNHMIVFWLSSFVSTTVDEGFPLFCISKVGGLSLSEKTIGKILSLCGLIFAVAQYIVFTALVTSFGLYGAIRISSTIMGPMIILLPISLWLNRSGDSSTANEASSDYINMTTFIYLSIVLATYRVCGLAFMSSLTVALNRTVIPSHRGAMNGLVALGGSVARAIGPIFSGALISFSLSSSYIPAHTGGFVLFSVIGLLGTMVASLTYFILRDEDDEEIDEPEN